MKPSALLTFFATCILGLNFLKAADYPEIINVSAYDPKEKQRKGSSYSQHDLRALRANGAVGLIARAGKGGNLDTKCLNFLTSADRAGMLIGVYYRLQNHVDAVKQADQFVDRALRMASTQKWNNHGLLLCGDYDAQSKLSDILRFMDQVEKRTGVVPITYLENSTHLKQLLSSADKTSKAKLRRAPYWAALYAHDSGAGPVYPAPVTVQGLVNQYNVWPTWTLWQYGGVEWSKGRSRPRVYSYGKFKFPTYFGNMDRPLERNIFNGSTRQLASFWSQHTLRLPR